MQHVRLGAKLREAYSELLGSVSRDSQVYVRSTKYVRTVQVSCWFSPSLMRLSAA